MGFSRVVPTLSQMIGMQHVHSRPFRSMGKGSIPPRSLRLVLSVRLPSVVLVSMVLVCCLRLRG